eukprot:GAFH01002438.1.p6 GENE.GAFH01002438.1~~GAFH01002438.1.p6  ORF type:complete len:82 (-),score=10.60 GAFH01002438.1:817-1062(-)
MRSWSCWMAPESQGMVKKPLGAAAKLGIGAVAEGSRWSSPQRTPGAHTDMTPHDGRLVRLRQQGAQIVFVHGGRRLVGVHL